MDIIRSLSTVRRAVNHRHTIDTDIYQEKRRPQAPEGSMSPLLAAIAESPAAQERLSDLLDMVLCFDHTARASADKVLAHTRALVSELGFSIVVKPIDIIPPSATGESPLAQGMISFSSASQDLRPMLCSFSQNCS